MGQVLSERLEVDRDQLYAGIRLQKRGLKPRRCQQFKLILMQNKIPNEINY